MLWKFFSLSNLFVQKGRSRIGRGVFIAVSLLVRIRYEFQIKRIKRTSGKRKLRIFFVIGDESKWKSQTVYEALLQSGWADPYAVPTKMDLGWIPDSVQAGRVKSCKSYLERKGVRCLPGCDRVDGSPVPLKSLKPDVVIYQQPWGMARCQHPIEVSGVALTFYLPYCIPAYVDLYDNFLAPFYRLVYGYFLQTEPLASYYRQHLPRPYFGCRILTTGTPYCDSLRVSDVSQNGCVIYAPHWHCNFEGKPSSRCNGTFIEMGKTVLKFALEHPDVNWVFKPHPMLRVKLIQSGYMKESDVDAYYASWERIGRCCYDSDYFALFNESRVMITDSISFLTEYLYVNKPLIHLVNDRHVDFPSPTRWMADAYVRVCGNDEFRRAIREIVIEGKDRLNAVRSEIRREVCGDQDSPATHRIMRHLESICNVGLKHDRH